MKKTLAILLALAMLLALGACGEKKSEAPAATEAPAPTEAPAQNGGAALPEKAGGAEASAAEKTSGAAETPAPSEAPVQTDGPEGYYKATEVVDEKGESTDMAELAAYGISYYLVLEADGTGYMDFVGEKTELKWGNGKLTDNEGNSSDFSYADGHVTMEAEGSKMVFARLTDEELANYKENGSGSLEGIFGSLGELFSDFEDTTVYVDDAGMIGDYEVSFVGAAAITDAEGNDALRVWYDFTNRSDEVTTAGSALNLDAEQGGEYMPWTYTNLEDDAPEEGNDYRAVAPGFTIRCVTTYEFDPAGDEVAIKAYNWEGEGVIYRLDPTALPGAPADDFVLGATPDDEVAYMYGVAETDDNVEILDGELVEDWDGEDAVLIRFRFTNTGDEETSFGMERNTYALQDGYGLRETGCFDTAEEEQDNVWADIAPGESIEVAMVFLLRSNSPIAVTSKDSFGDGSYIGVVFDMPD